MSDLVFWLSAVTGLHSDFQFERKKNSKQFLRAHKTVSVRVQFCWKLWTECLLCVWLLYIYLSCKSYHICNLGDLPAKPFSAIVTNAFWSVPASIGTPYLKKKNEVFCMHRPQDRASDCFCACWHAVPVRYPEAYAMGLQWSPFLVKSVAPRPCLEASTASFVWCLLSYTLRTGSFSINCLRFRKSLLWLPVHAHYAFLHTKDLQTAV